MNKFYRCSKFLLRKPDGVIWKETEYQKQKELEKRNPIFKRGGRR